MFLSQRIMTPEIMDSPGLSEAQHIQALRGLEHINNVSDPDRIIARPILEFARKRDLMQIKILDVACGGGDVPLSVARRLIRHGIYVELTLLDMSQTALQHAQSLAQNAGIPVQTICGDALHAPISGPFDVL